MVIIGYSGWMTEEATETAGGETWDARTQRTVTRRRYHRSAAEASLPGQAFATALKELLVAYGYDVVNDEDDKQAFLDDLQKRRHPPRMFAYHPSTLDAWLNGTLLPSEADFDAIIAMSDKQQHDDAQNAAIDTYDAVAKTKKGAIRESFTRIAQCFGIHKTASSKGTSLATLLHERNEGVSLQTIVSMLAGGRTYHHVQWKDALEAVIKKSDVGEKEKDTARSELAVLEEASRPVIARAGATTEFSQMLDYCCAASKKPDAQIARKLRQKVAISAAIDKSLNYWRQGRYLPPLEIVSTLADDLVNGDPPVKEARFLPLLYEDVLKQRAAVLWAEGSDENNPKPGLLLQACRRRVGTSLNGFALGYSSNVLWMYYENDHIEDNRRHIPKAKEKRQKIFDHTIATMIREEAKLGEQLGIVLEPWLWPPNRERNPSEESAEQKEQRDAAVARTQTLKALLVDNPALDRGGDQRVHNRRRRRSDAELGTREV